MSFHVIPCHSPNKDIKIINHHLGAVNYRITIIGHIIIWPKQISHIINHIVRHIIRHQFTMKYQFQYHFSRKPWLAAWRSLASQQSPRMPRLGESPGIARAVAVPTAVPPHSCSWKIEVPHPGVESRISVGPPGRCRSRCTQLRLYGEGAKERFLGQSTEVCLLFHCFQGWKPLLK